MTTLDFGERAAIALALRINAPRLLIDDRAGRTEAERHDLQVVGTLGVLIEAPHRGLPDLATAVSSLSKTSFYFPGG